MNHILRYLFVLVNAGFGCLTQAFAKRLFAVILGLAVSASSMLSQSSPQLDWERHHPSAAVNEQANAMTVDASGNVYVAGEISTFAGGILLIKYNSTGRRLWNTSYIPPGSSGAKAVGVALDGSGNVYVGGDAFWSSTNRRDFVIAKYNSSGTLLWVSNYNGPEGDDDYVHALAVDAAGNSYLTGVLQDSAGSPGGPHIGTVKYNTGGIRQWAVRHGSTTSNTRFEGNDIAVDAVGAVFVTGSGQPAPGLTFFCITLRYNSSGALIWSAIYDSTGGDFGRAIAIDASGNAFVTGEKFLDCVTLKYNPAGTLLWQRSTGLGTGETGKDVVVDAANNVYVACGDDGGGSAQDYIAIKYNSSGVTQWFQTYTGLGFRDDPKYIRVDGSGNVYISGDSWRSTNPGARDFTTVKYNASGVQQWIARNNVPESGSATASGLGIDGASYIYVAGTVACGDVTLMKYHPSSNNPLWTSFSNHDGFSSATGSTTDRFKNTYVIGILWNGTTGNDFVTVKYDSNGTTLWQATYDGPAGLTDNAAAIAIDTLGNVYVTGASEGNGTGYDYATIKYNSAGVQQWVSRYNGPAFGHDRATAIALDGQLNVAVTGYSPVAAGTLDYATVKYDAGGQLLWIARYNGSSNGNDSPTSIAIDQAGNVYVTGTSDSTGVLYDYATIKYNPAGVSQWIARYNGPANDGEVANAITVDQTSNVYVTGWSVGVGTGNDFATIKYNAAGNVQWVARYDDPASSFDEANRVAVDATGNVYVAGYSSGSGTGDDFTIIRYDPSGVQQWARTYDGPANSTDRATHLTLDTQGNAYITGYSDGGISNYDIALAKYQPNGTREWVARYDFGMCGVGYLTIDSPSGIHIHGDGDIFVTGKSASSWSIMNILRYEQEPSVSVPEEGNGVTAGFQLLQNHPNPFNPVTTIAYELQSYVRVTIKVHDLLGREVATLVNEEKPAGRHSVQWDASRIASGVYHYRMQAGGYVESRNMLLLK